VFVQERQLAPRANWKGTLKLGEVSCAVALYTAASSSDRIAFHTLNRKTGHRVQRRYVDSETGKAVEHDDQVKGYEVDSGDYVLLEPEDIAAAVPDSDKMLAVSRFVECQDIDDVYFDKSYYLAPDDKTAQEAYALIRDGMRAKKVAALAQTVLFRRVRTVLVRPHGDGLIATTLNFDYEVRSAQEAFEDVSDKKIKGEMLELAEHIIKTKRGKFDPRTFEDRYDAALADLIKAKAEGKTIKAPPEPRDEKVIDLMAALRESAGKKSAAKPKRKASKSTSKAKTKSASSPRRKAS
jgi:DNA end-binding protein Ku